MKARISAITAAPVLILAILACNMPGSPNSNDQQNNLSLTITAQALIIQDLTNQAMIKHADTNISQTVNTPTPTSTPSGADTTSCTRPT